VRKVLAVLEKLGLEMRAEAPGRPRRPDYLRMACTTASVSYRNVLTEEELINALLTGKVPPGRQAHIRTLLDEAPPALLAALATDAARWTRPGKLERNLARLAREVGASRRVDEWLKTG
jgi:hypothetical protein